MSDSAIFSKVAVITAIQLPLAGVWILVVLVGVHTLAAMEEIKIWHQKGCLEGGWSCQYHPIQKIIRRGIIIFFCLGVAWPIWVARESIPTEQQLTSHSQYLLCQDLLWYANAICLTVLCFHDCRTTSHEIVHRQ